MEGAATGVARPEHVEQRGGGLPFLNAAPAAEFVAALGGVFERSPWVAERVEARRPFADLPALHAAMVQAVRDATLAEQLALLCTHPELGGGELRADRLTAQSRAEQSSAGLDALDPGELARIARLNAEYRSKFSFPFIIAARRHTKRAIFTELERRLANDPGLEMSACLEQVYAIAMLRLETLVGGAPAAPAR